MPKIVDFALPPGGTIVDVAPSNATALDIESAGADYITVDTTGSGSVIIGKLLTLEAGMTFSGATTFTIPANEENAFLVEDGSGNDYLQIDTRTGAEVLRLSADGLAGIEVHVLNSGGGNNAEVRFASEIGFIADPDCQIRNYGANGIEFRFVSTDIFRINVDGAFVEAGKLGVGITSSLDADKLHVFSGDSGLTSYNANAKSIVVESDDHQGMTFAAPAAKEQAIYFINSTDNARYGIVVQGNSDRMFIRSNDSYALNLQQNKVGIASTLASLTHQLQTQDGDIGIVKNSADEFGNKLIFEKSRNATDGDHTKVNDNDVLGTVEFRGSDTNTFEAGASIFARVQGTPSDGSMPTELAFAVTPDGSTTPAEALNIRSNGNVGIGDVFPNYRLHVAQNASSTASAFYNTSTTGAGAGTSGSMSAYFENKVGPTIKLNNAQHEDSDGGRETGIAFAGEKANAGEQHTLAQIMASHDGTGDDQKGKLTFSVNDGDDDHAPSLTPLQILSDGEIFINQPLSFILTSDTTASSPRFQIHAQGSTTTLATDVAAKINFQTNSTQRMSISETGPVAVGPVASLAGKAFEANNGTQYIYLDTANAGESFLVNNSTRFTFYGGLASGSQDALTLNYGGTAYVTQSMGSNDASLSSDTNSSSAVYLATTSATSDTLVIDQRNGMVGAVTLVADIVKVKIYYANTKGAKSTTIKIKQHASAAKTVSYADVTVYSDAGSTSLGTDCFFSGGADHVMSTGVNDIDIVQITTIPTTTSAVPAYCSVIGQNFS